MCDWLYSLLDLALVLLLKYLLFSIIFIAGILALLDEREPELKSFALRKLNNVVDEFWAEISEAVEKM
jgi:hypothetical protein